MCNWTFRDVRPRQTFLIPSCDRLGLRLTDIRLYIYDLYVSDISATTGGQNDRHLISPMSYSDRDGLPICSGHPIYFRNFVTR